MLSPRLKSSKEEAMTDHHRSKDGEVQTETGEMLKGPKPLNLHKQRQRSPSTKQQGGQHVNERPASPPEGDDRTPDNTIGQVKYAAGQKKPKEGGAGKPQTSDLEPEKQGGIGGP